MTFDNLTGEALIRVYSANGELLRSFEKTTADGNSILWDGKNDSGRNLSSGVYYYLLTAPNGDRAKGRIAILR